jgi:hypothetical protein
LVSSQNIKIYRNVLETYFFKNLQKEKRLTKLKKLIVFLSESNSSALKLSHTIEKYFIELKHELANVYLTLPREPPIIQNDPTLSSFKDFTNISSKNSSLIFLNNPAFLLNVNDNFLLTHQKLALMQMELSTVHKNLKKDPCDPIGSIINGLSEGLEILILEKNFIEKSLDFSGRPQMSLENSKTHTKEDYISIELNLIKLKFIDFIAEKFRTKPYRNIIRRVDVDKTIIYFQTIYLIFKPKVIRFNLNKSELTDFMNKKPLSTAGVCMYSRQLLKKYFQCSVDEFLQKFEEHIEICLQKFPSNSNFENLALWHRIQLLEYMLNFNENLKFQKKIVQNMKIVKSQCQFSDQVQFKVACLELKYLVQIKDVEQLLSLLNNLYFFEPFTFDVKKAYQAIKDTFRLDLNPVKVTSILDKLMIITNYEIQKCQIDFDSNEHFLVDFWLFMFTQVEQIHLDDLVIVLRTDIR